MDAAEYKHVVLGPIFLKYISDAVTSRRRNQESTRETHTWSKREFLSEQA